MTQYLKDYPQINDVALHLDNDAAGRLAAKTIKALLISTYAVSDEPLQHGTDYNDYLKYVERTTRAGTMMANGFIHTFYRPKIAIGRKKLSRT